MIRYHRKYKTTLSKEDWHCCKEDTDAKEYEGIKKAVEMEREFKKNKSQL